MPKFIFRLKWTNKYAIGFCDDGTEDVTQFKDAAQIYDTDNPRDYSEMQLINESDTYKAIEVSE
jgi:hypothetical protein